MATIASGAASLLDGEALDAIEARLAARQAAPPQRPTAVEHVQPDEPAQAQESGAVLQQSGLAAIRAALGAPAGASVEQVIAEVTRLRGRGDLVAQIYREIEDLSITLYRLRQSLK